MTWYFAMEHEQEHNEMTAVDVAFPQLKRDFEMADRSLRFFLNNFPDKQLVPRLQVEDYVARTRRVYLVLQALVAENKRLHALRKRWCRTTRAASSSKNARVAQTHTSDANQDGVGVDMPPPPVDTDWWWWYYQGQDVNVWEGGAWRADLPGCLPCSQW